MMTPSWRALIVVAAAVWSPMVAATTLTFGSDLALLAEQKRALQFAAAQAEWHCQTEGSRLFVSLDLVVREALPTTGIPLTAYVTGLLTSGGITFEVVHEGEVVRQWLPKDADRRTVDVKFACAAISTGKI